MSAPPARHLGSAPNGAVPVPVPARRRRRPETNPLVPNRPKKPGIQDGKRPAGSNSTQKPGASSAMPPPRSTFLTARNPSPEPEGTSQVYSVVTTKRALLEGLRHHVATFTAKYDVDLRDENEFTRPVRLHRRDPRFEPNEQPEMPPEDPAKAEADEKEKARIEALKAERQRQKEENAKLIAPAAVSKRKPQNFKKKTEQVFRTNDNEEDRKKYQLRYEEALPWHLEDFDNRHTWVGSYEATLSECHAMLLMDPNNAQFRLVPLEKWYRFREKSKLRASTGADVEAMAALAAKPKTSGPKWLADKKDRAERERRFEMVAQKATGLFSRAGARDEKDVGELFGEGGDREDIDFEIREEFADDEEDPIIEGDEDTLKHAEEKMKNDQLGANVFGMNDEKSVEQEEELEKKRQEQDKEEGKNLRKVLKKREKNYDYDDESDRNPYTSQSESESEEEDEEAEGEGKKDEAAEKDGAKGKDVAEKGSSTPSGRKRQSDLLQPGKHAIKRPGSPNLSDASGNESARKKAKTNPKNEGKARVGTPAAAPARGAGSGSESEAARIKGKKGSLAAPKVASKANSKATTPVGSRAASPVNVPGGQTDSRSGSPVSGPVGKSGIASKPPPTSGGRLPSVEEILKVIPPTGIAIFDLSRHFKRQIPPDQAKDFISLVKRVTFFDKGSKCVYRKGSNPSTASGSAWSAPGTAGTPGGM